ncbi:MULTISPECIES: hypothetical protein [unclassified Mycolicibacterium]|nr:MULTISPECIES: hypothetical protein [unclassified Mycolicibacterium]
MEKQLVYAANLVAHAIRKHYEVSVLDERLDMLVDAWLSAGVW